MMTTLENFNPLNGLIEITDKEFRLISDLVYEKFGIKLESQKKALVRGRLNKLIKSLGLNSFTEYYKTVTSDKTGNSLFPMIDRISTNHSFFFRESDHFEFLRTTVLPQLLCMLKQKHSHNIRIWCAGCAGGEEAYSLAFVLDEFFGFDRNKYDIGILATDICMPSLKEALHGVYRYDKIKFAPEHYRRRYIKKTGPDRFTVSPFIRDMILFKKLNLMEDNYPFKGKFHIIFLRNVMIYFDSETRSRLVHKMHKYMFGNSYLFLGHSESLGRSISKDFEYIRPAVYKRI